MRDLTVSPRRMFFFPFLWWMFLILWHPLWAAPFVARVVKHFPHLNLPAHSAFPLENYLLWQLLSSLGVETLPELVVFHLILVLGFLALFGWAIHRRISPSLRDRAWLLFLASPVAFGAGSLFLPNPEPLTFLFMLLGWLCSAPLGAFLLGWGLGWTHYPSAFLGWVLWMVVRGTYPERRHWALLAGLITGWLTLIAWLLHLGLPPGGRLAFLVLWGDKILQWGVELFPFWVYSLLGPLWVLPLRIPSLRKPLLIAAFGGWLASLLVADRSRIAGAVMFWALLELVLLNPHAMEKLDKPTLRRVLFLWIVFPFAWVWENRVLLPWVGLVSFPR